MKVVAYALRPNGMVEPCGEAWLGADGRVHATGAPRDEFMPAVPGPNGWLTPEDGELYLRSIPFAFRGSFRIGARIEDDDATEGR